MKSASVENCWSTMGILGDSSCPQLAVNIHCRNCAHYEDAGRGLLDRATPEGYLDEWSSLLAKEKSRNDTNRVSVLVFRVGMEWLALPVHIVKEISPVPTIHRLPHRTNHILMGIANVRGTLHLCISLSKTLGIEEEQTAVAGGRRSYRRLVVVERERDRWAFPADEVHGIHRFSQSELRRVPATVAKARTSYTREMFPWKERSVGLLDDELLFCALSRSTQ